MKPVFATEGRCWRLAHGGSLPIGHDALVMGILNVTPDSFSDGGRYDASLDAACAHAVRMGQAGASIIDIGGESTRPGAEPVDEATEQARVLPVVEALAASGLVLSIDTYRAGTARRAIAAGAHIVNDVWGAQKDPAIARVAAETGAGLCLMHTGRERRTLPDVVEDQRSFLSRSIEIALAAGVDESRIVLDPGFGFAKDLATNLELMHRLPELLAFGFPILVGTSRKRFVREMAGEAGQDAGTAATSVLLRERGAAIFRVHDVASNVQALALTDRFLRAGEHPR